MKWFAETDDQTQVILMVGDEWCALQSLILEHLGMSHLGPYPFEKQQGLDHTKSLGAIEEALKSVRTAGELT